MALFHERSRSTLSSRESAPKAPPEHAAQVRLFVAHDPLLLLERAADAFLVPARSTPETPFPSPPFLLTLRQGGLRDDLTALARERDVPGWFDPPLCVFRELPDYLGATTRKPLDDFERAVLLASILRDTPGEVFHRLRRPDDFVTALDTLFGELIGKGPLDLGPGLDTEVTPLGEPDTAAPQRGLQGDP